ncbi:MAG: peptidylprolyl isomerase [Candidatus Dadabacteria bacterium]|nr:peptidylprolyl isomerase [Candidatus Dadabacteria bacterium]
MASASARHILVNTEDQCNEIKAKIEGGEDFGEMAQQFSQCPSGKEGGNLGEFNQGMMVPEFDMVVFTAPLNQVHGPVKTQFGYHLIEILSRS